MFSRLWRGPNNQLPRLVVRLPFTFFNVRRSNRAPIFGPRKGDARPFFSNGRALGGKSRVRQPEAEAYLRLLAHTRNRFRWHKARAKVCFCFPYTRSSPAEAAQPCRFGPYPSRLSRRLRQPAG